MADVKEPRLIGPAAHPGYNRGLAVGCVTLVVGVAVSVAAALFAVRHQPARTEVSDALYWDGVSLGWLGAGSALSAVGAVGVGLLSAYVAGRATRVQPRS